MKRAEEPARFAGLRNGDLIRVAKRVTLWDVLDGAMFVLVSMGVIVALLQWGSM